MTIHRFFPMLFGAALLFPGVILAQEKGNDLHYVLTRVDDPDPAVRESSFQICRMASAEGVKLIEEDLAENLDKPSASARKELQQIVQQQHLVRETQQKAREAHQLWVHKLTIEAYDAIGSRDPAWDEPVREAIELYYKPDRTVEEDRRLHSDMNAGETAKCTDPLFKFLHAAWHASMHSSTPARRLEWFLHAAQALDSSKYSASRKIISFAAYFDALATEAAHDKSVAEKARPNVEHFRNTFLAIFPAALQEENARHASLYAAAHSCIDASVLVGDDRKTTFDSINEVLPHELPESPEVLTFKGQFLLEYAWDARGNGWAGTVTKDRFQLFADRVSAAGEAFQNAWATDPEALNASAAAAMITVCKAQGAADETRELWFKRALEANPENYTACLAEIDAVDPRWIGPTGVAKLQQLARMFELSGNDDAGIPLLAGKVEWNLARSTVYSDGIQLNHDYFQHPDVWETISRVYVPYLQKHLTDRSARDYFIAYAAAANHWDLINDQLQYIEGYPDRGAYSGDSDDYRKVLKIMGDRYKH